MTQRRKTFSAPHSMTKRCSLVLGLSLIGGMGVLGDGIAFAQTSPVAPAGATASADNPVAPPAAVEPVRPATPPQPVVPRKSQAVAAPLPAAERATPSPIPAISEQPERFPPESSPASTSRSVVERQSPAPAGNNVPSPTVSLPQPTSGSATLARPNYNELYIDPTDYQVGATRQPGVVLSERSTGCEVTLQPGQNLPNSVCISRSGQPAGQGDSSGIYPAGASAQQDGVNIGPLRLSARGVSITPQSVQDFYNRTLRPMAMPGNGNASLMFPLTIPAAITSAFGWRIHPISGVGRFHAGTDIGAPTGTPVVAAYTGRVDTARFMGGYGLAVVLLHNNGTEQSLYGHLSEIFVQPGQQVQQGEVIGRVGSTGYSTGPHLHFEFRELTPQGWVALNPGMVLEAALARFTNPFQVAQATPASDNNALSPVAVKGLEDFGKLASDAKPSNTLTSMATPKTGKK